MGKVKLYAVIAGNNYWRLRTDREAAQYLKEVPCEHVKVILSLSKQFYLDDQMKTYRYCSLQHPEINSWIKANHLNRGKGEKPVPLKFKFSIDGTTHIYEYINPSKQKAQNGTVQPKD